MGGKTVCVKPRDGAHDKPSREESEKEQNAVGAKPCETCVASGRPKRGGATGGVQVVAVGCLLQGPSTYGSLCASRALLVRSQPPWGASVSERVS